MIDAGKVERLDVYTLSRSATSDYRFPDTDNATDWYSCDVVSDNPFMVHTISFSARGGGLSLVNTTAISME